MLLAATTVLVVACSGPPVIRQGPPQQRVVGRTFAAPRQTIRARLLDTFATSRSTLPNPFDLLSAQQLKPPRYSPDWVETFVDPGAFLEDYKRLTPAARGDDLLLDEPTGDVYWISEYATADRPVKFRCSLIVHFTDAPGGTRIDVYESVPEVWVGEHWAWGKEGLGFGRFHDIRFVEPTVAERERLLDLIDGRVSVP